MDELPTGRDFGRMEGKIDALLSAASRSEKRMDDYEGRLDSLETWRIRLTALYAGAVGALGALGSVVAYVLHLLK